PSTRSGADGGSVPAGCPSGDRYRTVRRADSTRDGSTGADGLAVVSGGLPADPCPVPGATPGVRAGVGRAWMVSESGAAVRELATCATDSRSVFSTQPARVTWIQRPDVPSATLVRRNPWGNFPMSAPAGAERDRGATGPSATGRARRARLDCIPSKMAKRHGPRTPVVLIVLDGWGFRPGREGNAVELGRTPTWHRLWAKAPRTLLDASGL